MTYNICMKRVNYYLADKQYQALNSLATEKSVSVSELLRRAVDLYLQVENEASTAHGNIQAPQSKSVEKKATR